MTAAVLVPCGPLRQSLSLFPLHLAVVTINVNSLYNRQALLKNLSPIIPISLGKRDRKRWTAKYSDIPERSAPSTVLTVHIQTAAADAGVNVAAAVRLKAHSPSVFHGSAATPAWLMRLTQPTGSLSPDICRCGMIHRNMWLPAWAPKVVNTLDQMMALIALGNFNSPADKTSSGFGWIGSTVCNIKTGVQCFLWTLCLRIAWNPTV